MHKGWNWSGKGFSLEGIREALHKSAADIVFLQEVVGENNKFARKTKDWYHGPQFERLADGLWSHYSYAQNAIYEHGHHGNVILSRFPIIETGKEPISTNRFEQRGILYCKIEIPDDVCDGKTPKFLWLFCVHLNLLHRGRSRQYGMLVDLVRKLTGPNDSVIIAGDFNDWNQMASRSIEQELNVVEAHRSLYGKYARTFPAFFPILCLDRIYVRGLEGHSAYVMVGPPWDQLSDHLPLILDAGLD
jgi:endonuclease/exonuclease/phosphatase family metal-dependent hydrolase